MDNEILIYVLVGIIGFYIMVYRPYKKSFLTVYYAITIYDGMLNQFLTNEELIQIYRNNLKGPFLSAFIFLYSPLTDLNQIAKDEEMLQESFCLIRDIVKVIKGEEVNECEFEIHQSKKISS